MLGKTPGRGFLFHAMPSLTSGWNGSAGLASRGRMACRRFPTLNETGCGCIWNRMTPEFAPCYDLQDRARLRERFYGADRTVLARL